MPKLEKEGTCPYVLPVDEANNATAIHEKIRRMNIPMPKSGSGKLLAFREKVWDDFQESFKEQNVGAGRVLEPRMQQRYPLAVLEQQNHLSKQSLD